MVLYAVWHKLWLWREGVCVVCWDRNFQNRKQNKSVVCKNLADRVGLSRGAGKNSGKHKNKSSKSNLESSIQLMLFPLRSRSSVQS